MSHEIIFEKSTLYSVRSFIMLHKNGPPILRALAVHHTLVSVRHFTNRIPNCQTVHECECKSRCIGIKRMSYIKKNIKQPIRNNVHYRHLTYFSLETEGYV